MTKASERKRVQQLRDLLNRANQAYFVDADPMMPDSEYDMLLRELADLEARYPELDDACSPTRRVGGEPIEGFETAAHAVSMQSIDNTYSLPDLQAWYRRVLKGLDRTSTTSTLR